MTGRFLYRTGRRPRSARVRAARAPRLVPALVAWLIVALLAAQALGFRHAILHASRLDARPVAGREADATDAGASSAPRWFASIEHSCAAFDAATLAASAPTTISLSLSRCAPPAPADARPAHRRDSPLALGYRSRAPPAPTTI